MPPFIVHAQKRTSDYAPSYDWGSETLSDRHSRVHDAVWHIPGWLERADALKLYELAFFARGPILEIGTYCGRSAVILATAVADAGRGVPVVSLDTDPGALMLARRSADVHDVSRSLTLVCGDATTFLAAIPDFTPGLVFVDADHSATGVAADLAALENRVGAEGLMLFHDYLPGPLPDTDGFPISAAPVEVAETVHSSWVPEVSEFAGTFGQSGLFRVHAPLAARRRRTKPPASG